MRTIYNGVTGRSILEFLHEISENIIIALNLGISFAEHVVCKPLLCANRRGDRQIVDCHFLKIFDDPEDLVDCCEILGGAGNFFPHQLLVEGSRLS